MSKDMRTPLLEDYGESEEVELGMKEKCRGPSAPAPSTDIMEGNILFEDLLVSEKAEMIPKAHVDGGEGEEAELAREGFFIEHVKAPERDPLLTIVDRVKKDHSAAIGGRIIPRGSVGFTLKNGKVGYLAPGRRRIWDPLRQFVSVHSLTC